MQLLIHALVGWGGGNLVCTTPRERAGAMAVSLIADADGAALLGGVAAYQDYHHVVGHNLAYGLLASAGLAWWLGRRWPVFGGYAGLYALHLLMDFYGSGQAWGLAWWWPFSPRYDYCPQAWELNSWQNFTVLGLGVAVCGWIYWRCRRTPLEYVAPAWDRRCLGALPAAKPTAGARSWEQRAGGQEPREAGRPDYETTDFSTTSSRRR